MFHIGANAKDEISLQCGAFTIQGILSMVNEPLQQANKLTVADTEAGAAVAGKSGLAKSAANAAASTAYWVVSDPVAAQNTLANIDKFIESVDSKRAALGAIQNHCPEIEYPKGRYIKHSHYKRLMVPLEPFFLPLIL